MALLTGIYAVGVLIATAVIAQALIPVGHSYKCFVEALCAVVRLLFRS